MPLYEVPVQLGGVEHTLRFRFRAWIALEDHGEHLFTVTRDFQSDRPSFRTMRLLLWAMLQHEEPQPTLGQVDDWLDAAEDETPILAALGEALKLGLPERPNGADPPPTAARGIGPPLAASLSVPSA
jgi:hypothetical protein